MKGTSSAKEFALSFWVKSATTGDYAIELLDYDNSNRGVTRTYTINAADTWEYKKVILPADTTGAFDNDSSASFACEFWLVAGTDYTSGGTMTAWATLANNKRAGGHTANAGASNNDYVRITGVQLEVGDVATDFEHRSYADELIRCQRYYQAAEGAFKWAWDGLYANGAGAGLSIYYALSPEMRAAASVTHNVDDKNNVSSSTITTATDSVRIGATCSSSGRTAMTRSSSGYIRLDAEL